MQYVCSQQSQKAVSAYFTIKQILPFDFAEQKIHDPQQNKG